MKAVITFILVASSAIGLLASQGKDPKSYPCHPTYVKEQAAKSDDPLWVIHTMRKECIAEVDKRRKGPRLRKRPTTDSIQSAVQYGLKNQVRLNQLKSHIDDLEEQESKPKKPRRLRVKQAK